MHCVGCGDPGVVINSCAPLCERCVSNTQGQGEFGDYSDELALEALSLELLEPWTCAPEAAGLDELRGTPRGTFIVDE